MISQNNLQSINVQSAFINYTNKGTYIPIIDEYNDAIIDIKKKLTVLPINSIPGYGPEPTKIEFHRTIKGSSGTNYLLIPRFFEHPLLTNSVNLTKPVQDQNIVFNGSLKDDQRPYCKKLIDEILLKKGVVGCAPTGSGKTVMASYIITQMKVKTLIIVHKEFLMNQWIQRLEQFVQNNGNQIKITKIQGKTIDTTGDICIGMLQSISMRDYEKGLFDVFKFVIIDEVHHICTKVFSKSLYKLNADYILGLSATPYRNDGLTCVLNWYMGEIIKMKQAVKMIPSVKIVDAEYSNNIVVHKNFQGKPNTADLINQISEDPKRNDLIIKEILALDKSRSIIVLSDRREHCKYLCEKLISSGQECGLYIGAMSEANLEASNQKRIICATYSIASEGYDNPKLDTLIIATGKSSNLLQCCGRILRRVNKNEPLIIDIQDFIYQPSSCKTRLLFYRENNYKMIEDNSKKGKKKNKKLLDSEKEIIIPEFDLSNT